MKVKICGLTRAEDAALAHELGAWALGFIFYPLSERHITVAQAGPVLEGLPRQAFPVGVFVNQVEEAVAAAKTIPLKALQFHGDETPEDCAHAKTGFAGTLIKALRPKTAEDLAQIAAYRDIVDYILIDATAAGRYGGSGLVADWALALAAQDYGLPVMLAGGLTPENVCAAWQQAHPFALDLAGGVETAPGVKDPQKMKDLFGRLEKPEEASS